MSLAGADCYFGAAAAAACNASSGLAEAPTGNGLTADALIYGMAETVKRFRAACGSD